jgi:hypothetical protein
MKVSILSLCGRLEMPLLQPRAAGRIAGRAGRFASFRDRMR